MTDLELSIDTHLEAYGETDTARRDDLLRRVWAVDGCLVDPPLDAAGHTAIGEMFVAVQSHYPDHRFSRSTGVDEHHGFARYEWNLVAPDGTIALTGLDVAEIGADGLLRRIVGFLGPVPAKEVDRDGSQSSTANGASSPVERVS